MVQDIRLDDDLWTSLNARGDFTRIDGSEYRAQRAVLRILEAVSPFRGENLTATGRQELLATVVEAIESDTELPDDVTATFDGVGDDGHPRLRVDLGVSDVRVTVPAGLLDEQ